MASMAICLSVMALILSALIFLGARLFLKQRLCELFRVERLQIVRLLAQADKFNRQAKLFLNGHHHSPLACSVELGDDEAGERDGLVKFARLIKRVHPRGRIEDKQHFVGRSGKFPG